MSSLRFLFASVADNEKMAGQIKSFAAVRHELTRASRVNTRSKARSEGELSQTRKFGLSTELTM